MENQIKKRTGRLDIFFRCGFFVLLAVIVAAGALVVRANYDYWVFRRLIADHYIFTDTLQILYGDALGEDREHDFLRDFDRMVMAVVTERIRAIDDDFYTYLYLPEEYERVREIERIDAEGALFKRLTADTLYVKLPNFTDITRKFFVENREKIAGYDNLVLDLRYNYGGLIHSLASIADLFLEEGALILYETTRTPFYGGATYSVGERYFDFGNIVILQNFFTASAAESLILALSYHLDGVTTVGGDTFGKSVGQVTIPLRGGYAIRASVLTVDAPDGTNINNIGIVPDISYSGRDILGKALGIIYE